MRQLDAAGWPGCGGDSLALLVAAALNSCCDINGDWSCTCQARNVQPSALYLYEFYVHAVNIVTHGPRGRSPERPQIRKDPQWRGRRERVHDRYLRIILQMVSAVHGKAAGATAEAVAFGTVFTTVAVFAVQFTFVFCGVGGIQHLLAHAWVGTVSSCLQTQPCNFVPTHIFLGSTYS